MPRRHRRHRCGCRLLDGLFDGLLGHRRRRRAGCRRAPRIAIASVRASVGVAAAWPENGSATNGSAAARARCRSESQKSSPSAEAEAGPSEPARLKARTCWLPRRPGRRRRWPTDQSEVGARVTHRGESPGTPGRRSIFLAVGEGTGATARIGPPSRTPRAPRRRGRSASSGGPGRGPRRPAWPMTLPGRFSSVSAIFMITFSALRSEHAQHAHRHRSTASV